MVIKSVKVMLIPNNRQNTKLFECAGVARWAYNWALAKQKEYYNLTGKFVSDGDLRKELTQLKQTEEYQWLNNYSNNITKQAIKDACDAYIKFFKKKAKFPKFKSKKKSKPSFYQDNLKIQFTETHVKLEKLTNNKKKNKQQFNWIRLAEHNIIPVNCKYNNPRITFDGLNWWISVGIEKEIEVKECKNKGVGIDLGIKDLAICSDDNVYENINKTEKIKKLEKKKRRLQRKVSNKYEMNKKGVSYKKTSNIKKLEKQILNVSHRLTNIRHNYIHQITSEIIKREPSFVVLEDLNVKGMMKNKHLAKAVQQQCFYEFYRQMKYKCNWNGSRFIEAPRFYPSSKMCNCCGYIKKDLNLNDRKWICPNCNTLHDRDINASVNLMRYGQSIT